MTPNEEAALAELEWELSSPHTLEEIAAHLGIRQRNVEKTEARALRKLRGLLEAKGIDRQGSFLREPTALGRRIGDAYPSNGMSPKRGEE